MPNPDIAFRKVPCKECGGLIILELLKPDSNNPHADIAKNVGSCPTCNGEGETYWLGDMVRKKCILHWELVGHGYHKRYEVNPNECDGCHGLGSIPSTELGDWFEAALNHCDEVRVCKEDDDKEFYLEDYSDQEGCGNTLKGYGRDPDPLTALKLALEKAWEGVEGG